MVLEHVEGPCSLLLTYVQKLDRLDSFQTW